MNEQKDNYDYEKHLFVEQLETDRYHQHVVFYLENHKIKQILTALFVYYRFSLEFHQTTGQDFFGVQIFPHYSLTKLRQ